MSLPKFICFNRCCIFLRGYKFLLINKHIACALGRNFIPNSLLKNTLSIHTAGMTILAFYVKAGITVRTCARLANLLSLLPAFILLSYFLGFPTAVFSLRSPCCHELQTAPSLLVFCAQNLCFLMFEIITLRRQWATSTRRMVLAATA